MNRNIGQVSGKTSMIIEYLFLVIFLALAIIFHLNSFHSFHNWGPDFAKYIAQAKSIVDGFDYLELFKKVDGYPGFPWGFPLLLSPVYKIFGFDLLIFKVFITVFYFLSLPIIYLIFRSKLSYISKIFILGLFVVSPWFFEYKNRILSDFPFMFFSLLSILLIDQIFNRKRYLINKIFSYVFVGLVISFTINIRTQGFVLLPTLLIFQVINSRNDREKIKENLISYLALELIPLGSLLISYLLIYLLLPQGNGIYLSLFRQNFSIGKIANNFKYYLLLPADLFGDNKISLITYGMTIPFFLRGIFIKFRDDLLFIIYSILTLGLLTIWPYQQGLRFIISLMPFYLYFVFKGAEGVEIAIKSPVWVRLKQVNLPIIVGVILILLVGSELRGHYINLDTRFVDGPYTEEAKEVFHFISSETEEDAVIMFRKSAVIPLYGNRRSVGESANLPELLSSNADYYLYHHNLSNEDLDFAIVNVPESFSLVFENMT
ncbi:MAG: glycosyltransferase family 39 protein, partial [Candidatus Lokiarchaeota archaeon]|nr:glycosyltransferase family 39 protein [Candidatus Lokiarchaeota archaeon]